ncbi:MAG: hypothetical protein AB7G47_02515 [Mycolicibacterium sp.]|uniref:hypothetical protein n=1 Tax=Mycolicibacterium sp. TaxID=2320850 RepID=UPI003D10A017
MSFQNWWREAHEHPSSEPIHHGVGLAITRQDRAPLSEEQIEIADEMAELGLIVKNADNGTYTLRVASRVYAC